MTKLIAGKTQNNEPLSTVLFHELIHLKKNKTKQKQTNTKVRDGPLENLWERSTKNIFVQGKFKGKKNSCTPINPKKYSWLWPNKNSYKEFDNEKIPAARKFPSPPITFLKVRPL